MINSFYACGDALGEYQFTHIGGYEAELAVKNLLLPFKTRRDYTKAVWTTYTEPQVAHSGYTEKSAKETGKFGKTVSKSFSEVDRSIIEEDTKGFVKLVLDPKGKIIGATVVSKEAGEIISLLSLAIAEKLKISALQKFIYPYPTKSEMLKLLALDHLQNSVAPWQRKFMKKWLSRPVNNGAGKEHQKNRR